MRTDIYYFSGTGNSLKVARDLAAEMGDAKVVSIPKVRGQELDLSAERIGVVFPVYMFGMPLVVVEFLKKLKAAKGKYIFAIATYGGLLADSLGQTARQLEGEGLKLSAGFAVIMPGNYTPLYGAIAVQKQNKMFDRERVRIKEIAKVVKEGERYKIEKSPAIVNWLFSGIYKAGSSQIPGLDKDFWADDNCNGCGICVKVCPVGNVYLENGKPAWRHKCEQCFACLQWCPKEAIQYKKSTIGRKRYVNPNVTMEDIIRGK